MLPPNRGINPSVFSVPAGYTTYDILLEDKGRTFLTDGPPNALMTFDLPNSAGMVEGFNVRIGVGQDGRPAAVRSTADGIRFPRESSFLHPGMAAPQWFISYDPGAYIDIAWNPIQGEWHITGGCGSWSYSDLGTPIQDYHLKDVPAATHKIDFGGPTKASPTWITLPEVTYATDNTFDTISTQEMFDLVRPGLPIRWVEPLADSYPPGPNCFRVCHGIVESFIANGTRATIVISGEDIASKITAVEIGPREAVRCIKVTVPGNFNDADDATLLLNDNREYLSWVEGDATLVRFRVRCTDDDSVKEPTVNVWVNGNKLTPFGAKATSSWYGSGADIDSTYCRVKFGDEIEISVLNDVTSAGDAQNLTVEMLFVQDREVEFWNQDEATNPTVQLVISGMTGTWKGLGNGVHAVVPDAYSQYDWIPPIPTTTTAPPVTYQTRKEHWGFGTSAAEYMYFDAWAARKLSGSSWITTARMNGVKIRRLLTPTMTPSAMYAYALSSGSGRVRNGVMRSGPLAEAIFTWWKLGDKWLSSFR